MLDMRCVSTLGVLADKKHAFKRVCWVYHLIRWVYAWPTMTVGNPGDRPGPTTLGGPYFLEYVVCIHI